MNQNLRALKAFLCKHMANKENITHMAYGEIAQGTFNIEKENENEFMALYSDAITDNRLCILEKQIQNGPLVIDVDLVKEVDAIDNERLYNNKTITDLVTIYIQELNNMITKNEDKKYVFYVFEKEKSAFISTNDNKYKKKDGFHIFSKLCLSFNEKIHLRNQVIKRIRDDNIFTNFPGQEEDIIDKAVIKSNCWFLYGSTKPDRSAYPYKVAQRFLYDFKKNIFEVDD